MFRAERCIKGSLKQTTNNEIINSKLQDHPLIQVLEQLRIKAHER